MRILYVCQYFPPEMGAPAARVHELSRHWVRAGHEVTVLTGFPNHPTGELHPAYRKLYRKLCMREMVDGIDVRRTWLLPRPNRRAIERSLNYISFWASASVRGAFLCRPDVVIGTSPQLLCALAACWIARRFRVPFIFEVRDLWPESLIAVGAGTEQSLMYRSLHAVASFLYRTADQIVVVSPAFKTALERNWGLPAKKIAIVENGVETDLFDGADGDGVRRQFSLQGKFVAGYVGTLGWAHGLRTILDAAEMAREVMPDLTFMLVGSGAERDQLVKDATDRKLTNVLFVDQQPRNKIPSFLHACDIGVVLLKRTDVFKTVIPTKLLELMGCGRAVVLGVEGQARKIVEEANAGLCIEPENPARLLVAIQDLRDDAGLRSLLGRNGKKYIGELLSRSVTAKSYEQVFESLTADRQNLVSIPVSR